MIRQTYLVALDFGSHGRREDYLYETRIGASYGETVDEILSGKYDLGNIVAVYKLDGERIEDVSSEVCAEILKYANTGKPVGASAEQFLDHCGFDIPNREAA